MTLDMRVEEARRQCVKTVPPNDRELGCFSIRPTTIQTVTTRWPMKRFLITFSWVIF